MPIEVQEQRTLMSYLRSCKIRAQKRSQNQAFCLWLKSKHHAILLHTRLLLPSFISAISSISSPFLNPTSADPTPFFLFLIHSSDSPTVPYRVSLQGSFIFPNTLAQDTFLFCPGLWLGVLLTNHLQLFHLVPQPYPRCSLAVPFQGNGHHTVTNIFSLRSKWLTRDK